MKIKKLRTDKSFQQFVSELKKKQTGENTSSNTFEQLPKEAIEDITTTNDQTISPSVVLG